MPDLDILIEMANFYDVDIRESLDGERKSEKMNKEMEETVLKVADYSNEELCKVLLQKANFKPSGSGNSGLYWREFSPF